MGQNPGHLHLAEIKGDRRRVYMCFFSFLPSQCRHSRERHGVVYAAARAIRYVRKTSLNKSKKLRPFVPTEQE